MKLLPALIAALLATATPHADAAKPQKKPAPAAKAAAKHKAPQPGTAAASLELKTDRDRAGYMIGMDVGRSLADVAPDLDMAALQRSITNALEGGQPLIAADDIQPVATALGERAKARKAGTAVPAWPQAANAEKAAWLVGVSVGRSLAPTATEFDMPALMAGLRSTALGGKPLLDEAQFKATREQLVARMQQRANEAAARNKREGEDFLLKNKAVAGVMTTRTGLQYQVLRDAQGQRPVAESTVRVNYEGRTLDGKVFDASKGNPVEFPLKSVIPGWTEGVQLMPVGAKYRFWIPSHLAYGAKGAPPSIGPNATLVFDVELVGLSR